MRIIRLGLAAAGLVALLVPPADVRAQAPAPGRTTGAAVVASLPPPDEKVPVDPAITIGRLPNGLRYYVRRNRRPANRAELRLVVNAGSVLEEDDQLGLAHVVEHMAFNGTRHFAGREITAFMESLGMQFGPSLNAFTSYDDTTFLLKVPTERAETLERAFLIMEDWAHGLTFDPKEVEKERGVIIEEWRQGRGASARLQEALFPVILEGSRYASRSPIGTKASLESFRHERLKRFYADWYRPDLMAVVAVGDFDPAAVEQMIKRRFSRIPMPLLAKPRPLFAVPDHSQTKYAVVTDPEAQVASVTVFNKLPIREQSTVLSYRGRIIDHLYTGMLNARLREVSRRADAPFVDAEVSRGIFVRTKEAATLAAVTPPEKIAHALEALLVEAERVARHGFTPSELEREKRDLLRAYDQARSEREKEESQPLAEEYIRNFLLDESLPGIAWEYDAHVRFLPGITLDDVNTLAREWTGDWNRVIYVSAPARPGQAVPGEAELARVVATVAAKTIEPYVDAGHAEALMEALPAPGAIARERVVPEAGFTEWVLSNGVRVILHPTTFKQDEVVFRATSPGGTSLAADADYVAAATSAQVVSAGGVGDFDAVALNKVLAGKVATVVPFVDDSFVGLAGGGSVRDLETILQLVHLHFTRPRADATAFAVLKSQLRTIVANRRESPERLFEDAAATALSQDHFRRRPLTEAVVEEMSLERSMRFFKERFADAGGFTFVFSGSFDVQAVKPLVARYLASLPASGRKETWKDPGIRPPRGVVQRVVRKGLEPKSRVRLVFTGAFPYEPAERVALRVLGLVLEGQLGSVLREDQSGTYGVKVETDRQKIPNPEYALSVDFACEPARADDLVARVFAEIGRLKTSDLSDYYVRTVREALLREYETDSKENRYMVEQIAEACDNGEDPAVVIKQPEIFRRVTATTIQVAARRYLDTRNYVRITLVPEAPK